MYARNRCDPKSDVFIYLTDLGGGVAAGIKQPCYFPSPGPELGVCVVSFTIVKPTPFESIISLRIESMRCRCLVDQ